MLTFLFVVAGWIFSLCLHEFSHALVAFRGGDYTVAKKGYLSFNPLRYMHPMLSIGMPLLFLVMGGLGLPGGAVYIEHWRLRNRNWESAVSLAGPLSNLILAILLAIPFRLGLASEGGLWPALAFLGLIEVSSVLLNLLPVPGLDGYGVIAPYLKYPLKRHMEDARPWGIWALFLVLWYIPAANHAFWSVADGLASALGIPMDLAYEGLRSFRFWQRY
jgi:Zn-dependent protease